MPKYIITITRTSGHHGYWISYIGKKGQFKLLQVTILVSEDVSETRDAALNYIAESRALCGRNRLRFEVELTNCF